MFLAGTTFYIMHSSKESMKLWIEQLVFHIYIYVYINTQRENNKGTQNIFQYENN